MRLPVNFDECHIGDTLWLLQGSRLMTDWENKYPPKEALATLERRQQNRVAMRLRELSQT